MDYEFISNIGQIAGIGGIALGIFFLLFRDVIRRNIFSTMSQINSYRLMRQLLYLVWSVAIIGILVWAGLELKRAGNGLENPQTHNTITTGDGGKAVILNESQGIVQLGGEE